MSSEILNNGHFFSPSKGNLNLEQVISEIFGYMGEFPEKKYEVIVGCDSPSTDKPFFPIAIVILRQGAGGRFFLKKMHYDDNFMKRFVFWKNRILQEVYLSCELALSLREVLEKENPSTGSGRAFKYDFQYIHADVGETGKTKEMVKEVAGLIKSNGFEPKIKPYSFAASNVADRYT
ncbi:MAG: hypothetical protein A2599_03400 [Candidatus Staskawiczbacteria bacterium RIFOXYD1_FULL_39_28]|nr:MAG: hypothetical protein A2599_03400 [Candidatus Staskawiczbacteria bacterium RIFOXYD1_FULL_39_28]